MLADLCSIQAMARKAGMLSFVTDIPPITIFTSTGVGVGRMMAGFCLMTLPCLALALEVAMATSTHCSMLSLELSRTALNNSLRGNMTSRWLLGSLFLSMKSTSSK